MRPGHICELQGLQRPTGSFLRTLKRPWCCCCHVALRCRNRWTQKGCFYWRARPCGFRSFRDFAEDLRAPLQHWYVRFPAVARNYRLYCFMNVMNEASLSLNTWEIEGRDVDWCPQVHVCRWKCLDVRLMSHGPWPSGFFSKGWTVLSGWRIKRLVLPKYFPLRFYHVG